MGGVKEVEIDLCAQKGEKQVSQSASCWAVPKASLSLVVMNLQRDQPALLRCLCRHRKSRYQGEKGNEKYLQDIKKTMSTKFKQKEEGSEERREQLGG